MRTPRRRGSLPPGTKPFMVRLATAARASAAPEGAGKSAVVQPRSFAGLKVAGLPRVEGAEKATVTVAEGAPDGRQPLQVISSALPLGPILRTSALSPV